MKHDKCGGMHEGRVVQEETHPGVLHGLLVELDLDRVQGGGVGEAVVLDRVIGVVALVNRHRQFFCCGCSAVKSEKRLNGSVTVGWVLFIY